MYFGNVQSRKIKLSYEYTITGNTYYVQGDFDRAMEMYQKSLKINSEVGHKLGMAYTYEDIGRVYRKLGQKNKAQVAEEKASKLFKLLKTK